MGYGDEIGAIVVAAQGGDALSIADASVALYESIAENLGIKSNNEGIGGFLAKVMAFFNRIARASANAVKDHVLAALLLASRDSLGGIKWVEDNKDDADIAKSAEKAKKAFAGKEIKGKKLGVKSIM